MNRNFNNEKLHVPVVLSLQCAVLLCCLCFKAAAFKYYIPLKFHIDYPSTIKELFYHLQGDLTNAQWSERSQEVNFANVRFVIGEHRLKVSNDEEEKPVLEQDENAEKGDAFMLFTVTSLLPVVYTVTWYQCIFFLWF